MKRFWTRFIPWLLVATVLTGLWVFLLHREHRYRAENTVIVDLIGDNQEEEGVLTDTYENGRRISLRLIVDAGGAVLIILGLVVLIVAFADVGLRP